MALGRRSKETAEKGGAPTEPSAPVRAKLPGLLALPLGEGRYAYVLSGDVVAVVDEGKAGCCAVHLRSGQRFPVAEAAEPTSDRWVDAVSR